MNLLQWLEANSLNRFLTSSNALRLLGGAVLANISYKVLRGLFEWLPLQAPLTKYQSSGRSWSMVTGASAGIGFGFAKALASRGFNVILLGHNPKELRQSEDEIQKQCPGIEVKSVVLDAITASAADIDATLKNLGHMNLTILVNNVGGLSVEPSKYYRRIDDTTAEEMDRVLSLNVRFMAQLTRLAIPILAKNGPSLVLNVGSASMLGMPGVATYSGCKAFVMAFTKAIAREMKADGVPVDILALILGEVKTQVNAGDLPPGTPSGSEFAEAALRRVAIAVSRGALSMHPWMCHAVQDAIVHAMPGWMTEKVLKAVFQKKRREQTLLQD
ncbi:3-ketoacyl-CoA reductase [Colletotrichum truncatum]|uniref:3-ketoacyl-CoA reductase n=1 Tax=Colletotrichum truncatum TaxID=5467 RepID=A0ACC3YE58_COLTU|nr:3-ketoacyl-CoA reductase [Colletotrichum truncatum]KAF6790210.1 3-ketoacyl-CoA reductase [Colletotrichum truncatum]